MTDAPEIDERLAEITANPAIQAVLRQLIDGGVTAEEVRALEGCLIDTGATIADVTALAARGFRGPSIVSDLKAVIAQREAAQRGDPPDAAALEDLSLTMERIAAGKAH